MYGEGISKIGELIDLGVKAGVVEKSGSWFSYDSQRIGQGRENAKSFLKHESRDRRPHRGRDPPECRPDRRADPRLVGSGEDGDEAAERERRAPAGWGRAAGRMPQAGRRARPDRPRCRRKPVHGSSLPCIVEPVARTGRWRARGGWPGPFGFGRGVVSVPRNGSCRVRVANRLPQRLAGESGCGAAVDRQNKSLSCKTIPGRSSSIRRGTWRGRWRGGAARRLDRSGVSGRAERARCAGEPTAAEGVPRPRRVAR